MRGRQAAQAARGRQAAQEARGSQAAQAVQRGQEVRGGQAARGGQEVLGGQKVSGGQEGRGGRTVRGRGVSPRPARPDAAIARLAGRGHGVVSFAELAGLGVTAQMVWRRVERGWLHPIHRGVYAVGHRRIGREGRWRAAVLACGPGAALGHRSAAERLGLLAPGDGPVAVVSPGRRGRGHPRIRVHEAGELVAQDVTRRGGILCTGIARTLADLAATGSASDLERAIREADFQRRLSPHVARRALAIASGRPGATALRRALSAHDPLAGFTRSRLERRFIALCRRAGLPLPRVNEWVATGERSFEVDFTWPVLRLAVETNGRRSHGSAIAFERDAERAQLLVAAGWRVMSVTWLQVRDSPAAVARRVAGAIEAAVTVPPTEAAAGPPYAGR